MRLRPIVVLVAVAVLLSSCSDDPDDTATPPAPAPAGSVAAAEPSVAAPTSEPVGRGKPEIVKNPDGTINSGGPRPGTSESVLTAGGFGPYKIGVAQKDLESGDLIGKVSAVKSGKDRKSVV